MMKIIVALLAGALLTASVLVVGFEAHRAFLTYKEPLFDLKMVPVNVPLKQGTELQVDYFFNRDRFCQVRLDRFVVHVDTEVVMWRSSVAGGAVKTGPGRIRNKIETSETFPPGRYRLVTFAYSHCTEGMHAGEYPPVEFEVIP